MATTIDRRRNNGPAFSSPPVFVSTDAADRIMSTEETGETKFFLQTGLVAKCNGSAYYEGTDGIKLVATVHGPRPFSRATGGGGGGLGTIINVETRYAPFAGSLASPRRAYGGRETSERALGERLRTAVAKAIRTKIYPKSEISCHVVILDLPSQSDDAEGGEEIDDGERRVIAAGINALSAALADAAIEMVDLVAAAAVKQGRHGVVVGVMPHREEVTFVHASSSSSSAAAVSLTSDGKVDGDDDTQSEAQLGALVQEAIERAKVVNLAISKVLIS